MFGLDVAIKLPIQFDPQQLQADLTIAQRYRMATHPLENHDGTWQALNLIYSGGGLAYTHDDAYGARPGYGTQPPKKTEVLDHCHYFDEVLDSFDCEILMARLSTLPAGGRILHHYDPIESVDFGMVRLHIPVVTHKNVYSYLGHIRQRWAEGEVWYGDFTFPHRITNASPITRVHMIVDFEMNDKILELFPRGYLSCKERRAFHRRVQRNMVWYERRLNEKFGILKNWAPAT